MTLTVCLRIAYAEIGEFLLPHHTSTSFHFDKAVLLAIYQLLKISVSFISSISFLILPILALFGNAKMVDLIHVAKPSRLRNANSDIF